MKKIGFIGLGTMGLPMANNLLKAGYELIVYNRSMDRVKLLEGELVTAADTPAEAAARSEVVFTMLSADKAVEEIVLGRDGVIEGAASGLIVVDCTTINPATSKKLAQVLAHKGMEFLDAPVTGSEPHAVKGVLTFMVGGNKEIFDKCFPLFEVMGQKAVHVGDHGTGSTAKLANNLIAVVNMLALAEGVTMAAKAGINPETFMKVIQGGGAGSGMAEYKLPKIYNRDFTPTFKNDLMYKDLSLISAFAAENEVPVPALSMTKEFFRILLNKGLGHEDVCAIVKLYEEWARVEVKK
nr:NAD(P)-binding domain-containing protein [Desulfitibacter alkalitolerans]